MCCRDVNRRDDTLGNLPGPAPYRSPDSYVLGTADYYAWLNSDNGGWISSSTGVTTTGGYDPYASGGGGYGGDDYGLPGTITPAGTGQQGSGTTQQTASGTSIVNTMAPPVPAPNGALMLEIDSKTAMVAAAVGLGLLLFAAK